MSDCGVVGSNQWVCATASRGRVLYRIPKIGYALVWTQVPGGQIGLIAIPALLLIGFALARIWRGPREGRSGVPAP